MLISVRVEVPETVTGLIGAAFIGLALFASICANRREGDGDVALEETVPVAPTGNRLSV
jgi:hypothetical protein